MSNTAFTLGVNAASINSTSGGTGADLMDLHLVKWPSTTQLHGTVTSNAISYISNCAFKYVGVDSSKYKNRNSKVKTTWF